MTLRRATEMSGPRKFLVVGGWTPQADSSAENTRDSFSSFLSYARQNLPVEIGTTVPDGHQEEEAFCRDCHCHWEVVGRALSGSSDSQLKEAIVDAQQAGRKVIVRLCETSEDREEGRTDDVLFGQMKSLAASISDWSRVVIAFEALWASNTGVLATAAQVQEALAKLRHWLRANVSDKVANSTRILYAGSVSSSNCRELAQLEDLDGFLVGSAALTRRRSRDHFVARVSLVPVGDARGPQVDRSADPAASSAGMREEIGGDDAQSETIHLKGFHSCFGQNPVQMNIYRGLYVYKSLLSII
ncbi:triosephosphate isomerase [Penaeus vannamei]|uniref:Triosephosphate isomerase n=1 Tax=Penaeus vannamei TaxID=6689 RepID=A0A3R7MS41_PENVA|nr:triosephosphate isomerase [Penaeus vannamei]